MNKIEKYFVDEKGNKSGIIITSEGNSQVKIGPNYKLQTPQFNNKYMKKGAKAKGTFRSDIGIKSQGFAPVITLATIIAIGSIVIALLMWRL